MLLSKRAEMFLPDQWPAYFSRAKGCEVWDLDGRRYVDVSIMGIGTNTLGYGNAAVDAAVTSVVQNGNMSSLNCPEEVELAERLLGLHPWAQMVRLARSGGEANSIAIRIARAASGRDKVAVCGYHGWHDWYLSANLGDDNNLAGHLLPGLEPKGVPKELRGTAIPFNYNDFNELESIVEREPVGVIKMEVRRSSEPSEGFLNKVRDLATRKGIVLVFDECTSGFRASFGGIHKLYGVEPDIAVFGKALGNGYAITAIVGRQSVMENAQATFISSTFWTERIGPSAGLATLSEMQRVESWRVINEIGRRVQQGWRKLAEKHNIRINVSGIPAISSFEFLGESSLASKTLFTQEMLRRGFLAGTLVYVCTEHTEKVLESYWTAADEVFQLIGSCAEDPERVRSLLAGPVCHSGFKRLA